MTETSTGIARRTLAKGAAWAVPTVAVAAAAPVYAASGLTTTTTTLPPCISSLDVDGGTYPVNLALSGCSVGNHHWDFRFKVVAATETTRCKCNGVTPTHLRVTVFDNPSRSRLWITNNGFGGITGIDWTARTADDPRLFVQKIIPLGGTWTVPTGGTGTNGDLVRRVGGGSPYSGYEIDSGTTDVGHIEPWGDANDSFHVLFFPDGNTIPCATTNSGPMAYYRIECGGSATPESWTLLATGQIDPCIPMIEVASVCRFDSAGDDRFRLGIRVLNPCGKAYSDFKVTNIQRNGSEWYPDEGVSVWSGPQSLTSGTTYIDMTSAGNNGNDLWISFTADNGLNVSQVRVNTDTTACPPPIAITSATNNPTTCPSGATARTIDVAWTGIITKIQHRIVGATTWTNKSDDLTSAATISLTGADKCAAVEVRLCNGGSGQNCDNATLARTVLAPS